MDRPRFALLSKRGKDSSTDRPGLCTVAGRSATVPALALASFLRVDVVQTVRWEEEEVCAGERQIAARPWDRVHVKHSPSRAAL